MLQARTLMPARSYIFENNVRVHTGYSWRIRPYIAESKNVALAIGKWKLGIWEYRAHCNDLLECPPNNSLPVCNSQCSKQSYLNQQHAWHVPCMLLELAMLRACCLKLGKMLKVIHWRSVSWDLLVTGTSIYRFILIWFVFSWWENTLQWKKSQKNTKTQSTTAQIYTCWDWQKKMSSFDSKKYDIPPSCWWDYSYDVEGYWSWVESTGKDHVQSLFEKRVPAILVWTFTLSVNRAWL